jgi:mediator of RNA polymerase II transcription subunit 17
LSENLTKLAGKIDWKGEFDGEEETAADGNIIEDGEETNKKTEFNVWPWDSVRNRLKSAFTEVCVLSDVITIAKDKRYMVLDPVQQEQPDQRQLAQLFSKKRVSINQSFC